MAGRDQQPDPATFAASFDQGGVHFGKLGELIEVVVQEYLILHHPEQKAKRAAERKEKRNPQSSGLLESPAAPKWNSRRPSAAIIRQVILRDGLVCSYVDPVTGRRCASKQGLELDLRIPWSHGGQMVPENLHDLCIGHHGRVSFLVFEEAAKFRRASAGKSS